MPTRKTLSLCIFSLIRASYKWLYLNLLLAIPAAQSQTPPRTRTANESPRPQLESQKSEEFWAALWGGGGGGDLG